MNPDSQVTWQIIEQQQQLQQQKSVKMAPWEVHGMVQNVGNMVHCGPSAPARLKNAVIFFIPVVFDMVRITAHLTPRCHPRKAE